jgi:DNA-binding CsgD family transcriptional regulator
VLLDREGEREALEHLLSAVRTGESRALVVRGDAGIGKTALLEHLAERAAGCRIVRAVGVEAEQELAFAALNQVCAPMLDALAHLPAPQREALRTAFGLSAGSPPDRFMIALAVLGLLAEVAREQPLVCLVDDAQWLDMASAQVLGFAARRLRAESTGMVFAVRDTGDEEAMPELAGLPEVQVSGLPDHDARTLLASAHPGPADRRVLDRIVGESRGNPLALLELPRGFTPAELAGGFGPFGSAALPQRIEESFRRQLTTLSPMTQQVLLIAAAEPVGDPVLVWRAGDRLGIGVDTDLVSREASAELVEFGSRVRFRHPLLPSAIYQAAPPDARRTAHWALAQVTDPVRDPDRRAWHRAQAATGPDEDVAAELEHCAGRAQARGGPAAAAAFFERASELTPDPERRGKRQLAAAYAELQGGMPESALRLLALADATPLGAMERALADRLRARVAFTTNHGQAAPQLLLKAATELEGLDVRVARETYLEALQAAWFSAHLATGPDLHDLSAAARAEPAPEQPRGLSDLLLDGLAVRYADGYAAGAPLLKRALEGFLDADPSGDVGMRWHWFASTISMDLWEEETCDALTGRFVQLARASGTLAPLPLALTQRAVLQVFTGDLAGAGWLLDEFAAVREAMGVDELPYAAQLLAVWRGREREAAALITTTTADSARRGEGVGVIAAGWMQALLCNSLGRFDEALSAALPATEPRQEMGIVTWCSLVELVTAAAAVGEVDVAAGALARLTGMTRASGTDWALGLEARCRALVSAPDAAEHHYREAVDRLARTRIRGELARTHLHYGEWLRHRGRRSEARDELHAAHTAFAAAGMDGFAARAANGLAAMGETVRKRVDTGSGRLTTQEEQVARLARDGLSNAEIGVRLFISKRTVEWHLSKVFTKLGITSRRQLR